MSAELEPYYSRQTLAEASKLSVRRIDWHIKNKTSGLTAEKHPGIGVLIQGTKARRFIEMMNAKAKAKKLSTHITV